MDNGELRIQLRANDDLKLASAVVELNIETAHAARAIVTSHLGAFLARLAFETDGLVSMRSIEVVSLSTGQSETGFLYAGPDADLAAWPNLQHHPNAYFHAAFAVYREGLTLSEGSSPDASRT